MRKEKRLLTIRGKIPPNNPQKYKRLKEEKLLSPVVIIGFARYYKVKRCYRLLVVFQTTGINSPMPLPSARQRL